MPDTRLLINVSDDEILPLRDKYLTQGLLAAPGRLLADLFHIAAKISRGDLKIVAPRKRRWVEISAEDRAELKRTCHKMGGATYLDAARVLLRARD